MIVARTGYTVTQAMDRAHTAGLSQRKLSGQYLSAAPALHANVLPSCRCGFSRHFLPGFNGVGQGYSNLDWSLHDWSQVYAAAGRLCTKSRTDAHTMTRLFEFLSRLPVWPGQTGSSHEGSSARRGERSRYDAVSDYGVYQFIPIRISTLTVGSAGSSSSRVACHFSFVFMLCHAPSYRSTTRKIRCKRAS
jgi:hypothetical protein